MSGEIKTAREARRVLNVAEGADAAALRRAFHAAVKAAHPDHGGDAARLRRVLEAHRLLCALIEARAAAPRPQAPAERPRRPAKAAAAADEPAAARDEPPLRLSIAEAFQGARKSVRLLDGRLLRVSVPAGVRSGERLRISQSPREVMLTVSVLAEPGAALRGGDLWLTRAVPPGFLKSGGRLELDTPLGKRRVWIPRTAAARGLYRLAGQGLPARGGRAKGHIFLKLEPDPAMPESPTQSLLKRFASSWAA